MQHWLKPIGYARGPLKADWIETRPQVLRRTGFPRRPRVEPGDRFVYYASVWKVVFAVVEVLTDPEESRSGRALAVEGRTSTRCW